MSVCVYAIRNKVNGKTYVGQTVQSVKQRWGTHRRDLMRHQHHNPYLQRAWDKYGKDAFEFVVLETCSEAQLDALETAYMVSMDTLNRDHGYNLHHVVGGKQRLSDSTKAKISASNKGRKVSDATKAKISAANAGHEVTDEQRAKLSEAHKGKRLSDETKAKMSATTKGRKQSPDHISARVASFTMTPEGRARIAKAMSTRVVSDETRAKMAESARRRYSRGIEDGRPSDSCE